MAVTVTTPDQQHKTYDTAQTATVKEGHLLVLTQAGVGGETVAIYAPGRWTSVDAARNPRK